MTMMKTGMVGANATTDTFQANTLDNSSKTSNADKGTVTVSCETTI